MGDRFICGLCGKPSNDPMCCPTPSASQMGAPERLWIDPTQPNWFGDFQAATMLDCTMPEAPWTEYIRVDLARGLTEPGVLRLACRIAVAAREWVRREAEEWETDEDGLTVATGTFDEAELVASVQAVLRAALQQEATG